MSYFFVFQNTSYKEEMRGGFLWAPQKSSSGKSIHHWSRMKRVKKGDIIFNSCGGKMVAIIIAKEDCKEHEKPKDLVQLNLWEKEGWLVSADYYVLKEPIVYENHMNDILKRQGQKYAPFAENGRGNQGYLFEVTPELATYLIDIIGLEDKNVKEVLLQADTKESLIKRIESELPLRGAEREQIVKVRIGQSIFKDKLLKIEEKCKLCGVFGTQFLIASHIKPWSHSTNEEKLDHNNGLLLCPNHDALFDKGYISFTNGGNILITEALDSNLAKYLNVNEGMNIKLNLKQKQYMEWHRKFIFKSLK